MSNSDNKEFANREEWQKWLEENHSSTKEIYVIIHKKSEKTGLKYQETVEEAICYGWIDSKMQSIDRFRFRQRFSPRKKNSIWSKINKETAKRMIQVGKMKQAGLETIVEAKRNGQWDEAYSSKMQLKVPNDLAIALKENELARSNFYKLSNSTKLRYIYWVDSSKKIETRRKRIVAVVEKVTQKAKL